MQNAPLQIAGFIGAILILVAYVAYQFRKMDSAGAAYNLLNAVGAGILAYVALHPLQIGFAILETTWTLVSIFALMRALRARA
jgi:hypothetical protein